MKSKHLVPLLVSITLSTIGQQARAEAPDSKLWGQAQGMSAAVLLAHTTEPLLWGMGAMDGGREHLKPLTGLLAYGLVSTGIFLEKRWGLYASVALPAIFWTPQLVMLGTNAVGWTNAPTKFNGFSIPMVAMESFVAFRSVQLLRRNPRTSKTSQLQIGTTGTGVYLAHQF